MGKKVIIIDDSRSIRQAVRVVLVDAGYQVVEAVDGVDGLSKIRAMSDASLVICDINMPIMNGIDMVETVQREGIGNGIPIVMLTTEVQSELVLRAKAAGVKGWIVKPFKPDLFLLTVTKLAGAA